MFSWAPPLSLNSGWVPLRCVLDPNPSTAPLRIPHNGEHKQNLSPTPSSPAQYGLVICAGKDKTGHYSVEKQPESVCMCVCFIAYATSKQTRHREAQTDRETCNKSEILWEGYDRCL